MSQNGDDPGISMPRRHGAREKVRPLISTHIVENDMGIIGTAHLSSIAEKLGGASAFSYCDQPTPAAALAWPGLIGGGPEGIC